MSSPTYSYYGSKRLLENIATLVHIVIHEATSTKLPPHVIKLLSTTALQDLPLTIKEISLPKQKPAPVHGKQISINSLTKGLTKALNQPITTSKLSYRTFLDSEGITPHELLLRENLYVPRKDIQIYRLSCSAVDVLVFLIPGQIYPIFLNGASFKTSAPIKSVATFIPQLIFEFNLRS